MSTHDLKLELIMRLLRTNNEGLLNKVAALCRSTDQMDEDSLTDEHHTMVKEHYAAYRRGELESHTWEQMVTLLGTGKGRKA